MMFRKVKFLVDGENIKDLKLDDYRNLLGMVTQESVLFNDSVFNNILMGKPDATEEEVMAAAKIANAHEFIEIFRKNITPISATMETNFRAAKNKEFLLLEPF
jgi:ABC-type multidrug transport system fused ATPase/permease subunit